MQNVNENGVIDAIRFYVIGQNRARIEICISMKLLVLWVLCAINRLELQISKFSKPMMKPMMNR